MAAALLRHLRNGFLHGCFRIRSRQTWPPPRFRVHRADDRRYMTGRGVVRGLTLEEALVAAVVACLIVDLFFCLSVGEEVKKTLCTGNRNAIEGELTVPGVRILMRVTSLLSYVVGGALSPIR